MPYATNDGVRIYYETAGSGPPLLLHHGFTDSIDRWRDNGYVTAIKGSFSLILVDARGHGRSDKPHDPAAHTYDLRVRDVLAVLDAAGIARTHFWGYSMGGRIGYCLANAAPARLSSLTIGGAHPYPADPEGQQQMADALLAEAQGQPEAPFIGSSPPDPDRDPASLAACALATRDFAGATERLAAFNAPTLIYCGTEDPVYERARRAASLLPHATFVAVPGLNHVQGWKRSDLVLPHVQAFLASVR